MTGPLNRRLSEMRAANESRRPPEATALMNRTTQELGATGILDRIVVVGQKAPLFARPNLAGKTVQLEALLERGPVILSFFRGRW
jgi:hypothetical protein